MISTSVNEIKVLLEALEELGVIIYRKQSSLPQITWLTPRQDVKHLTIDTRQLEHKLERDKRRALAMIEYLKNDRQCRTQQIAAYFDENIDALCGICDNCLNKNKRSNREKLREEMMHQIFGMLQQQAFYPQDLIEALPEYDEADMVSLLRELLEEEKIRTLPTGELEISG